MSKPTEDMPTLEDIQQVAYFLQVRPEDNEAVKRNKMWTNELIDAVAKSEIEIRKATSIMLCIMYTRLQQDLEDEEEEKKKE